VACRVGFTFFFLQAVLVLFNLPDFMIISAYVLLALVWAEAFLQSRNHWLSVRQFRRWANQHEEYKLENVMGVFKWIMMLMTRLMNRMWLLSYLIFNACLYAGQLVLYTLLFLPKADREFLYGVIMLTLTIINFALPLILLVLFFYLSIMFAGFPFKSRMALVKLNKICKVMIDRLIDSR